MAYKNTKNLSIIISFSFLLWIIFQFLVFINFHAIGQN